MTYLLLNILFSSFFILCIKWVQNCHRTDVITVGAINYVIAAICALPAFHQSSPTADVFHGYWTGGTMGVCYFVAFFFLIVSVRWVGASSSAAVSRLSLVIPIVAGIFFWGEIPNAIQAIGIGIAFLSLMLVGNSRSPQDSGKFLDSAVKTIQPFKSQIQQPERNEPDAPPRSWLPVFVLGVFFIICGMSRMTQQACNRLCDSQHDYPAFLLMAFVCSGIPSIFVLGLRQRSISGTEFFIGCLLGISNYLQSHFILMSLDVFEDSVFVFTATSTGGLVFTSIVAVLFLHERLGRNNLIGILFACIAIVLLQTKT